MEPINQITKFSLLKELKSIENTNRIHRIKISKIVLQDVSLFKTLLEIAFEYNNELSIKALWVTEYICEQRMDLLAMNFDYFIDHIIKLKEESPTRASAKICNLIAQDYTSKYDSPIQLVATQEQISKIIELCFEWLQSDYKAATKANAMESLYELGINISWIHYELKLILKQMLPNINPGFSTRAKNVLKLMAKRPPLYKV